MNEILSRREGLSAFEGAAPLRRSFAVRRRRKNGLSALLASAALRALLVVAMPVALVVWVLYSPYFLIQQVRVGGGARVSAAWVEANLRPLVGRHILAVSLDGVRRRLSAHPWVAAVELRRELPDRLRVQVSERRPVALLGDGQGLTFLDAAGMPIAPCTAGAGKGLLVVRDSFPGPVPVQAALDVVAELRRAAPAWGLAVHEVEALEEGDWRVSTAALPFPLLVRAGSVAEAVIELQQVLPEIRGRFAAVDLVDLRQPRRLVVRPATPAASAPSAAHRPVQ